MPLKPEQVAAAIRSGVDQKIADGNNLYLVVRNGCRLLGSPVP